MPESVFIVFGSASDSNVFEPLSAELEEMGISCKVNVLSAHRTPKELEKALKKTKAKIFVAGAGLSSALPGVVASRTLKPIIGIACAGAFEGIDSFLSTVQMPPGIPVLGVSVGKINDAARHVQNYLSGFEKIVLVETQNTNPAVFAKAKEALNQLGVPFEKTSDYSFSDKKSVYVAFVDLHALEELPLTDSTVIVVPVKISNTADDAKLFFATAKHHLFVGVNRGENAALAAAQLVSLKGKYDKKILAYRKGQAKKVLEANKKIQERV